MQNVTTKPYQHLWFRYSKLKKRRKLDGEKVMAYKQKKKIGLKKEIQFNREGNVSKEKYVSVENVLKK